MTASKEISHRLGSDLKRVEGHVIQPHEYEELPKLTDEMLARGQVNQGGSPRPASTRFDPEGLVLARGRDQEIESGSSKPLTQEQFRRSTEG